MRTVDEILKLVIEAERLIPGKERPRRAPVRRSKPGVTRGSGAAKKRPHKKDSLKRAWGHLRREYKRRFIRTGAEHHIFDLTLDEWLVLWTECPPIQQGSKLVPAWVLRGKDHEQCVTLQRLDQAVRWRRDNVGVFYRNVRIF